MKKRYLHFIAATLCAVFTISLTGCGSGTNSFTWFVENIPANLDPQIATNEEDVIACENLYSGLVRKNASGELEPELCTNWTVSSDGLTYTFNIKSGLTYVSTKGAVTEYAITAEDFVYAFRRLFRPVTKSTYASEFMAIENGSDVLAGLAPESALGVYAADDLTLVFRLSQKDDNFLEKLTLPCASPCDEDFFDSTKGTYGLTSASTLSSGHFYIYNWTSSGLFLRRDVSGSLVNSLRLVQNTSTTTQTAQEMIENERCTAAIDETCSDSSLQSVSFSDTTWALVFNCGEDSVFSSAQLRRSLSLSALSALELPSSGLYTASEGLVPDGLTVDGLDYQDYRKDMSLSGDARTLYMAYMQANPDADIKKVTLMLPADSGLSQTAQQINSQWQKELSLFFSVEEVEQEDFDKRIASGDYSIAIVPVKADGGSVYSMLNQFTTDGGGLGCYTDSIYSSRLAESNQTTGKTRCSLLAECEKQLISECVAVPLFSQQKQLLIANGVKNLIFDPFGPVLDLTYTTKN